MKIEKREKHYCFDDIKIGECFATVSGGVFIKANISDNGKYGEVIDGAVNLETGEPEYFGDGARVVPVFAKISIEEKIVSPIVHAHWIGVIHEKLSGCSNCSSYVEEEIDRVRAYFHFCPTCGAKMDEETNNGKE